MNTHSDDSESAPLCDEQCPAPVADEVVAPPAAEMEALEAIFGAMSDRTRLRILSALAAGPLCVCDLASVAGVTQSAVSHQLRILRDLDLVRFDREGKRAVYRLADDHVRSLLALGLEHANERGRA